MGLLEKSAKLGKSTVDVQYGGLLARAGQLPHTHAALPLEQQSDESPEAPVSQKDSKGLKYFLKQAMLLVNSIDTPKCGLLCLYGDHLLPVFLKGFDITTLNKFRLDPEYVKDNQGEISKEQIKTVLSLREFLAEDSAVYHVQKTVSPRFFLFTASKMDYGTIQKHMELLHETVTGLDTLIPAGPEEGRFKTPAQIGECLQTAELDNLYISKFAFSFKRLVQLLAISLEMCQEVFLLHIIHHVIFTTFRNAAYSVKDADTIYLYLLSASRQNSDLLSHRINKSVAYYIFGTDSAPFSLIQSCDN